MKASPGVIATLEELAAPQSALLAAAKEAAYGACGKLGDAAALGSLESTAVDAFLADALASAPLTVVGMGVDHATAKALAEAEFGGLPDRAKAGAGGSDPSQMPATPTHGASVAPAAT